MVVDGVVLTRTRSWLRFFLPCARPQGEVPAAIQDVFELLDVDADQLPGMLVFIALGVPAFVDNPVPCSRQVTGGIRCLGQNLSQGQVDHLALGRDAVNPPPATKPQRHNPPLSAHGCAVGSATRTGKQSSHALLA